MASLKSIIDRLNFLKNKIEQKTYDLDNVNFKNSDSTVIPKGEALFFSDVTLAKPSNLEPENIYHDVTIMGVTGTHECPGPDLEANRTETYYTNGEYELYPSSSAYDGMRKATITVDVDSPEPPEGAFTLDGPKVSTALGAIIATAKITSSGMLKTEKSDGSENTLSDSLPITVHSGGTRVPTAAGGTIAVAGSTVYYTDNYTLKDEPNLRSDNIKDGVKIFGVEGTYDPPVELKEQEFDVVVQRTFNGEDLSYQGVEAIVCWTNSSLLPQSAPVSWSASLRGTSYCLDTAENTPIIRIHAYNIKDIPVLYNIDVGDNTVLNSGDNWWEVELNDSDSKIIVNSDSDIG